uniref:Uncharacterized protein n=1 Tax=Picea sitchensis TaxID=3332 RepID=D5ADR5_PICSI|nr:unknown [Picea sitchensis]
MQQAVEGGGGSMQLAKCTQWLHATCQVDYNLPSQSLLISCMSGRLITSVEACDGSMQPAKCTATALPKAC